MNSLPAFAQTEKNYVLAYDDAGTEYEVPRGVILGNVYNADGEVIYEAVPYQTYVDSNKTLAAGSYFQSYQYKCSLGFTVGIVNSSTSTPRGSYDIEVYRASSVGGTRTLENYLFVSSGTPYSFYSSEGNQYVWGIDCIAMSSTPYYNLKITNVGSSTQTVHVLVYAD